jgi:hypothetical protein
MKLDAALTDMMLIDIRVMYKIICYITGAHRKKSRFVNSTAFHGEH